MNVIITGASRGLGFAMAEKFAANGHDLFLCSQNEVLLYQSMETLTTKYPASTIKAKAFDLSKKNNIKDFGEWVLGTTKGSGIDVLINNAGNFYRGVFIMKTKACWRK